MSPVKRGFGSTFGRVPLTLEWSVLFVRPNFYGSRNILASSPRLK